MIDEQFRVVHTHFIVKAKAFPSCNVDTIEWVARQNVYANAIKRIMVIRDALRRGCNGKR